VDDSLAVCSVGIDRVPNGAPDDIGFGVFDKRDKEGERLRPGNEPSRPEPLVKKYARDGGSNRGEEVVSKGEVAWQIVKC
jgi:hypothetical protein